MYRAHAEQLDGALLKVETLLASIPDGLAFALFDPVTITEDGALVPSSIDQRFLGRRIEATAQSMR